MAIDQNKLTAWIENTLQCVGNAPSGSEVKASDVLIALLKALPSLEEKRIFADSTLQELFDSMDETLSGMDAQIEAIRRVGREQVDQINEITAAAIAKYPLL